MCFPYNIRMAKSKVALPPHSSIAKLVSDSLHEDIGDGDISTVLIAPSAISDAQLICREPAILCGVAWFEQAFHQLNPSIEIDWLRFDGESLSSNDVVCRLRGSTRSMLSAERTALNLLQTLSGTATTARQYTDAVTGTHTRILDTRKTLPGMRLAQKYAVCVGGAHNHRIGLFDRVLIKENHIAAAGSIAAALRCVPTEQNAIVEVESIAELQQALVANVSHIMLDNFTLNAMSESVAIVGGRAKLEVSGNVSLPHVREIAATGVDYISIGALTKHLKAIDFSMRFVRI